MVMKSCIIALAILWTFNFTGTHGVDNKGELFSPPPFTVRWDLKMGTPMIPQVPTQTINESLKRDWLDDHLTGYFNSKVIEKEKDKTSEESKRVYLQFGRTENESKDKLQFKMPEKPSPEKNKPLADLFKNYDSPDTFRSLTNLFETKIHLNIEF